MRLSEIALKFSQDPFFRELLESLSPATAWHALASEARPFFVAAKYIANPTKILLVTSGYDRGLQWQARLALYGVPPNDIRLLPSGLSVLFEDAAPETVALSDRIGALRLLVSDQPGIVIATPQAALERTLPAEILRDSFIDLRVGQTVDSLDIMDQLKRLGYEPSEPVRIPGQYSRRGGILDIFPMGSERPVRIEFFDDLIESMRTFDPQSQRSIGAWNQLTISPSRETIVPERGAGIIELIERSLELEKANLDEESAATLEAVIRGDMRSLEQRTFFDRLDLYRPLVQPESESAIDLVGSGWVILDEPLELEATAVRAEEELAQALAGREGRGEILHSTVLDYMFTPFHFADGANTLCLSAMNAEPAWIRPTVVKDIHAASLENYKGQAVMFTEALKNWLSEGVSIIMGTDQPMRSKSVLSQVEIFSQPGEELLDSSGFPVGLHTVEGNPAGGFILTGAKIAVISDQELFGVARLKLAQRKFSDGVPVATVLDLKPGDYVVHINFGIGIYQGLAKRLQDGVEKEFLHIEYKAPDRLFVPADQLDRIQKYMSPGEAPPKINRLTGGDWQKTVGKAREEAREFARDLIQLYANRKKVTRPSYGPDSPWQSEMENTFPWQETASQLQAIRDVKQDLKTDYPMDRLICGDVGFGKTEVAIRGAFKVAQAGKQVVILCPTTILSEQHFRSFVDRLAAFPTRLALLDRFTHAKERGQILRDLASGDVDIVIGTHALLNSSIKFKDLGLVIIDEEQKFGVKHKEALKALRVNVDVLAMSATPIPRTLSMAMMNIREMSLISDPPPGRLPVRTFVRHYSREVVREAILRELARGGQVFYVYNRVDGIYHVAEQIKKLVPTARVAVGHGQLHEKELEPVMVGFIKGEIDILVSTTIVESGLDIPNANTLIVENADYFGLSQLYQLRGRVGRSDRQAYSYLLYQGTKVLSENAQSRLTALAEFSTLGSGYSLAHRDLQIRGAGDILGAKQSGQMSAVGYDLYTQLIEAEVQFLKTYADGERPEEYADPLAGLEPLPSFDLPVKALIPESYIDDQAQRLYSYKALMTSRTPVQLLEAREEMSDRYGQVPPEVEAAVAVMRLRLDSVGLGIQAVNGNGGRLAVTFKHTADLHPRVFSMTQRRKKDAYMSSDKLIWPFVGSPLLASEEMMATLRAASAEVEEQRASLGVR